MTRTNLGLSLAGALFAAALIAGCGGGGGSSPAPIGVTATASPVGAATINPATSGTVNFTGPGTKVTVSVTIPRSATKSNARSIAAVVPGWKNFAVRTMANTAPTAKMRLAGQQQARSAQSSSRSPAYVSPGTYYMEFVINAGSTIDVDEVQVCTPNANTCTGSFDAPISTGLTATLFLYDASSYLLSAGSVSNVTIVAGTANTIPITLDGVVAGFLASTTLASGQTSLFASAGFNDTVTMAFSPVDADGNTIGLPGVPVDPTFTQITQVSVTPQGATTGFALSGGPNPIAFPADPSTLSASPQTYAWTSASGSAGSISWQLTPTTTGTPLIPAAVTSPGVICGGGSSCYDFAFASLSPTSLGIVGPGMAWEDSADLYQNGTNGASFYGGATWNLEIGQPPASPPSSFTLSIEDNQPYPGNAISFADSPPGSCTSSNVLTALPTLAVFTWPSSSVALSVGDPVTGSGSCVLVASDSNGNSTTLTILVNDATVTIQQKKRQ